MAENLHSNHRDRVRKEFLEFGFKDGMPEHKLLEMLLFFSIPRKDTNPLAHRLLNKFGSIDRVISASTNELMKIEGVGESTAMLLKLMLPVSRAYISSKSRKLDKYSDINSVSDYLVAKYMGFNSEVFAITSFDGRGVMVGFDVLGEGDTAMVDISMRKIIETVLERKAVCTVISHNHPGGTALPSSEDLRSTRQIYDILKSINIKLLDHIIICDDDYVSLLQSREYNHIFK